MLRKKDGMQVSVHQNLSCSEHIARLYYTVFFSVMYDHGARFSTIQLEKVRYAISTESEPYFFFLCENWNLLRRIDVSRTGNQPLSQPIDWGRLLRHEVL